MIFHEESIFLMFTLEFLIQGTGQKTIELFFAPTEAAISDSDELAITKCS